MEKNSPHQKFSYFMENEKMKTFQILRLNLSLAACFGERKAKTVSKISTFSF